MTSTPESARPRVACPPGWRIAGRGGSRAGALLVWLVMVALVIHGASGAVLQILGPLHRHAETPRIAEALDAAIQRSGLVQQLAGMADAVHQWRERVHAQAHFADERSHRARALRAPALIAAGADAQRAMATAHGDTPPHAHSHGLFERHVHAAADASVVAVDGHGGDKGDGLSASLAGLHLPMHLPAAVALPDGNADPRRMPWPRPDASTWRSADLKSLKRPPRA
ncbi:hypothetical protein CDN99_11460 [Roseateles aquatilis]|uniref:Uncharacterized protein n=1 Tax=Roseateles aquatilis TaxID=431061 RepID=A0A246JDX4_9BURK|nr:hypothetical protein [Roseateles aquatilis]OWQ90784.1 hypothetical protein CDN99_11460 [Roseateles aquatilis]